MKKHNLTKMPVKFLIIGRTSSGKSSITKKVCTDLDLKQVKSYTTRPKRRGETDKNSDHLFIKESEVVNYINDIVAYTEINDYKYFVTSDILDESDVYVIDPKGVQYLKEKCSDRYKFIEIYIRVPKNIAQQRFIQRGGSISDFNKRYNDENAQFTEYEKAVDFHYHLINDGSIDEAVSKIKRWIIKEQMRSEAIC